MRAPRRAQSRLNPAFSDKAALTEIGVGGGGGVTRRELSLPRMSARGGQCVFIIINNTLLLLRAPFQNVFHVGQCRFMSAYGGLSAVRRMPTRLCKHSDLGHHAAQRLRHSARAALQFHLKRSRLERPAGTGRVPLTRPAALAPKALRADDIVARPVGEFGDVFHAVVRDHQNIMLAVTACAGLAFRDP